jgi:hypothetical protein
MVERRGRLSFELMDDGALEIHLDRTGFMTLVETLESLAVAGGYRRLPVTAGGRRRGSGRRISRVTLHLEPTRPRPGVN